MIPRLVLFALLTTGVWLADAYYHARVQPQQSTSLALAAVNGNDRDAVNLRANDAAKDGFVVLPWVLSVALFVMCFGSPIVRSRIDLAIGAWSKETSLKTSDGAFRRNSNHHQTGSAANAASQIGSANRTD